MLAAVFDQNILFHIRADEKMDCDMAAMRGSDFQTILLKTR